MLAALQGQDRHLIRPISARTCLRVSEVTVSTTSVISWLYLCKTTTCPIQPNVENSWGHRSQRSWRTRDQTYISHLALYTREIHVSGHGKRQIWIFPARKSNYPLKQCRELGDRFPGGTGWDGEGWSLPLSILLHTRLFLWGFIKSNMVWAHSTYKQINSTDPWSCSTVLTEMLWPVIAYHRHAYRVC